MVTMTSSATEKVQDFIQEYGVEGDVGLRVAVLPGGCSGFQYGVEIDYVTSMMGQGFTFQNPQASGGGGCGSSFTV